MISGVIPCGFPYTALHSLRFELESKIDQTVKKGEVMLTTGECHHVGTI